MDNTARHSPPALTDADKDRAKRILIEILRISNGRVDSTTQLFKAFYFAHLYFAGEFPGYLSNWPIVKLPKGPGIGNWDMLLKELIDDGVLTTRRVELKGPFQCTQYNLSRMGVPVLDAPECDVIRKAVQFVKGKNPDDLSEYTHACSRSWNDAKDGEELNIYVDTIDDEEHSQRIQQMRKFASAIDEVWPN